MTVMFFVLVLCPNGGRWGGVGQTLCSERSELHRAGRPIASAGSWKRSIVHVKLETRQAKKPRITKTENHTENCSCDKQHIGSGTADSVAWGEGGWVQGLSRNT